MKNSPPVWKSLKLGLIVLIGLVIYAYGFQVTQVSLDEISSPRRQESLTRVLRALAHPDILAYDKKEVAVNTPVYVPCPAGSVSLPEPDTSGPYIVMTPSCAEPRSDVHVEGFNFEPTTTGRVYFIPPSEVTLNMGEFQTDTQGHFTIDAKIPPRPAEEIQNIRAITQQNVGSPHLTQTAYDTWNKIIETVFLALLATTFGIMLAIPISFFAARNLMKDVTSTLSGLALSLIGWPAGIWLGAQFAGRVGKFSATLTTGPWVDLASILVSAVIVYLMLRWALPQEEQQAPGLGTRAARLLVLFLAALVSVLLLFLLTKLGVTVGDSLELHLGSFSFLGSFVFSLSDILNLLITTLVALATGGLVSAIAGRLGKMVFIRLSGQPAARLAVNMLLGALAGAALFVLVGAGINWFYEINDPKKIYYIPGLVGALLGVLAALLTRNEDILPIGLVIYYITRTILNALRSIEALIMVIVFVVWVGIGPFAGVLALSLHTIAALSKLYSEQVESILAGPLEAIKATGATRLQTIIYAVIPQIIPPYISFTMYRWDINVRMSTIIGFAGGGGIGFLLIQNINLLNYRAASAQMLAIAVVVAMMDMLSSYMRERVV